MRTVRVQTPRPYDVHIGYGMLKGLGGMVAHVHKPCRVALVTDETVARLYARAAEASLEGAGYLVKTIALVPGESTKNMQTAIHLVEAFAEHGLTRADLVVALGGGVVGDIAGFAASIYMRGIDVVQVPTTLLASIDASVGGKTGVNLPQGKNYAGSFWQPIMVVCDCDTFQTLPFDVFQDGVAEGLKYGVICDRGLFEKVSQGAFDVDCMDTVARCIEIKAEHVTADERDQGKRTLLNFGHTVGHALERLSGYSLQHGHAVAIGMVGATLVAESLGVCVMGSAGIVMAMLERLELPVDTVYTAAEIAQAALSDKKRASDTLTLVLPQAIGKCILYPVGVEKLPGIFRLAKGERA